MFKKTFTFIILTSVAACGSQQLITSNFNKPIGSELDEGRFGNPTMNNMLIHSGQKSATFDLAQRFDSEVIPTVNFAFNSAKLDGAAQATLQQQATWIRQFPEVRFRVYGHTDLVGGNRFNKRLGLRRAQSVVNFFISQGIGRDRLEAVASFGEEQPIVFTQTEERQNRRTVTQVSGFVEKNRQVLNGKYGEIIAREYIKSAEPVTESAGAAAATALNAIAGG